MLSYLLFIIVMEALSREFRTECLWKLVHGNFYMQLLASYARNVLLPLSLKLTYLTRSKFGSDEFKTIPNFCYLGDVLGQFGRCTDAVLAQIRSVWKAFHRLLPIITQQWHFSLEKGNLFVTWAHMVLLNGSETWPLSKEDFYHMQGAIMQ